MDTKAIQVICQKVGFERKFPKSRWTVAEQRRLYEKLFAHLKLAVPAKLPGRFETTPQAVSRYDEALTSYVQRRGFSDLLSALGIIQEEETVASPKTLWAQYIALKATDTSGATAYWRANKLQLLSEARRLFTQKPIC